MPSPKCGGGSAYSLSRRKMRKYTLYIVRRHSTNSGLGLWGDSAPCVHCTRAIRHYGFKKIVYIDKSGCLVKKRVRDYKTNFITSCNKLYHY